MDTFVGLTMDDLATRARGMGARLPDLWAARFPERVQARLAAGTPLVAGVETLLDTLDKAGIAYAVASNGWPEKMQTTIGQHPTVWARVADLLFSGASLGCPKPDPGVYLSAARALGVKPARRW